MAGTALIEAAQSGDLSRVKRELEQLTARDTASLGAGRSPVQEALYRGHGEVVDHLHRVWRLDIHEAAALGDVDRLEEIIQTKAKDVNSLSYDGWTPLHLAAFMDRVGAVKTLLQEGADLGALSSNAISNTPLHASLAGAQSVEVVQLLIRDGADVNHRAGGGVAPLHLAASRGSKELVKVLLAAGADPATTTDDGKTAADIASERGHPELAELL